MFLNKNINFLQFRLITFIEILCDNVEAFTGHLTDNVSIQSFSQSFLNQSTIDLHLWGFEGGSKFGRSHHLLTVILDDLLPDHWKTGTYRSNFFMFKQLK